MFSAWSIFSHITGQPCCFWPSSEQAPRSRTVLPACVWAGVSKCHINGPRWAEGGCLVPSLPLGTHTMKPTAIQFDLHVWMPALSIFSLIFKLFYNSRHVMREKAECWGRSLRFLVWENVVVRADLIIFSVFWWCQLERGSESCPLLAGILTSDDHGLTVLFSDCTFTAVRSETPQAKDVRKKKKNVFVCIRPKCISLGQINFLKWVFYYSLNWNIFILIFYLYSLDWNPPQNDAQ